MGLFRNVSAQFKDAMALAKDMTAVVPHDGAVSSAGDVGAVSGLPEILYATPQADIDRALRAGETPRRGVIGSVTLPTRFDSEGSVDKVHYGTVKATVRARLAGGELGAAASFKQRMVSWKVHELLEVGLEVPVVAGLDGTTSAIDWDALARELEPRLDEAKAKVRARRGKVSDIFDPIRGAASLPGAINEYFRTPTPPNPVAADDDPLLAPVDGTTWDQYVHVLATAQTGRTGRSAEQVAEVYGIPASQWASSFNAWQMRITRSQAMAERLGRDLKLANERVSALRKQHGKDWFPTHAL